MNKKFSKKVQKTLLLYNIFFVLIVITFCYFLPKILFYPPNSINTEFEKHIDLGFNYNIQCTVIVILATLISNGLFIFEIRKVRNWEKYVNVDTKDKNALEKLEKIKLNCFKIPSRLYIVHALIPPFIAALGLFATRD